MAESDNSEWRLLDTDLTTQLAIIPAGLSHLYFEINEPGSGELKLPMLSNTAGLVSNGMFCQLSYRGSIRGGFFVDNFKEVDADSNEAAGRWMSVSGRGPLALLETAIVWSDGSGSSTREFTSVTKAAILKTLIDEAQARGGLSVLTYDFTATDDSSAVAWTDSESYALPVGTNLLDVARQFAATGGFDYEILLSAGTFNLSAYSAGIGTNKSTTVKLRIGVNCEEAGRDERGGVDLVNAYLTKYKNGYLTVTDPTSIAAYMRREKLLSIEQAQSPESATTYTAAKLANAKDPLSSKTLRVYDGVAPYLFADYAMGDTVTQDRFGTETADRILGIQADFDGVEFSHVVLEMNAIIYDVNLRLEKDLDWLLDQWNTAHDSDLLETTFWSALGSLPVSVAPDLYRVSDLLIYNGILYISLLLDNHSSSGFNCVYQYNIEAGGVLTPVGSTAYPTSVYRMCQMGGDIYVAGNPDNTGSPVEIYKWDGATWSSIGVTNSTDFINCMATDGTNLYVGMDTSSANIDGVDIAVSGVGKWDGANWTAVGSIVPSIWVYSLLYHGGTLYAGCSDGVRKYSAGWGAAVGTIAVRDMQTYGTDIVLAMKDDAPLTVYGYVNTWDGTGAMVQIGEFSTGGTYDRIERLKVNLTDIYAVGDFTVVDGDSGYVNVAKYSGGSWSPLEGGVGVTPPLEYVFAVEYDGSTLYVGGRFTVVNTSIPAQNLAVRITNFADALDYVDKTEFDMGAAIHNAAASTITDNDEMGFWEDVSQALKKITWANIKSALQTFFNTAYLRLDTTNNPVTGQVEIIPPVNGTGALYLQTLGDAYTADIEQYTVGNNVTSPTLNLYRESSGAGNITAAMIDGRSADSGAGSVSGDWINFQHESVERFSVDFAGSPNIPTGQTYNINGVAHTHAGGAGDVIDSGIVVGQLTKGVTDSKHITAAAIIPPATNILTLTNSAAATLALNITAAKTLTLTTTDNYTLTIPATGTAALLGVTNLFTGSNSFTRGTDSTNLFLGGAGNATTTGTKNIGLGVGVLISLTNGIRNTAIGYDSLKANTTGYSNVAIGDAALISNVDGIYNLAIGIQALKLNISGNRNVAIGLDALQVNLASDNVALGFQAANKNTSGINNMAIGSSAMFTNTTGGQNIAIGYNALYLNNTTSNNVAIGSQALENNIANSNIGIGYFAGNAITTGTPNIAIGTNALDACTTGTFNTAIGSGSAGKTTGGFNTAIGASALANNVAGISNVAIGVSAMASGSGSRNVIIGTNAGFYETGSDKLFIDNASRTSEAVARETSFLHGSMAVGGQLQLNIGTTTNNAVKEVFRIQSYVSTAASGGANGFGAGYTIFAETATDGTYQQQALIAGSWIDATNATRKAKLQLSAYDTAARLGIEIEASGSLPLVRVFSAINYAAITPTVVAGDLYNDSGQTKHGSFTNGLAGWFERCIWSGYAEVDHNGAVTSQSLFTATAKGTRTLPANFFKQGKAIRVRLQGHYTTDASAGNATINVKFGSTTFRTTGSFALDGNVTDGFWALEFVIVCETTGATGTVNGVVGWQHTRVTGGTTPMHVQLTTTHTPVTLDTTASQVFDVQWTATDAGTSVHVDTARIWEVC